VRDRVCQAPDLSKSKCLTSLSDRTIVVGCQCERGEPFMGKPFAETPRCDTYDPAVVVRRAWMQEEHPRW
jgi:hypothetical protein